MKRLFRAEPACIEAYNLTTSQTIKIMGDNLVLLEQWLNTGKDNDLIQDLIIKEVLDPNIAEQEKGYLKQLVKQCQTTKAPLRSKCVPEIMNIELTTRCPLRCSQCYCDLHRGKDIKKEVALEYIAQAAHLKIPFINLSGGETLVYPHLMELLELINEKGLSSAIAISGWGFDLAMLAKLKAAGVDKIYVSLNGSTPEINAQSRDGYELAINALQLLQADQQVNYHINWVARNDNVSDFPNMVSLGQKFGVKSIVILESKPDASYVMQASLSQENFLKLANYLKKHDQQEINIEVEPCFSPLRSYINNYYFWNRNTGVNKGCGAGRNGMAVDVDGNLIPCRHLLYPESFANIEDYWWNSELLNKLRSFEDNQEEPCRSCYLNKNCVSCRAVADKVEKNFFSGNHYCPIGVMAT
ncbi:MAG: radical SAM protein [Syntrophomonadaceae bacterium]|jgi:pyrroloquinoline quinone biosynthesis protein E|nr:radical SAM protein [Syntrophomonadaceae bacterium]